jgi:hypothetical protein
VPPHGVWRNWSFHIRHDPAGGLFFMSRPAAELLDASRMTQTGRRGSLRPFARKIERPSFSAANLIGALRWFEEAQARCQTPRYRLQANRSSHPVKFRSFAAMFGSHENVDYAERFLKELVAWEGSSATARHHAGPTKKPAQTQYVCRAVANMVARGFVALTAMPAHSVLNWCRDRRRDPRLGTT